MTTSGVLRCPSVVGRLAELAAVDRLVAAVTGGSGGVLLLDGEAGLGKSRLAAEAADRAVASGARVAVGRASSATAVPYRPLSEALVSASGRRPLPDDPRVNPYRAVLGRLVPAWASSAEPVDVSVIALGEAVLAAAAAFRGEQGLLLVLEDLHWADSETLAVVEYLADNLAGERAGLLLTTRPAPAAASRLGRSLASRGSLTRVVLAPLPAEQAAEMVTRCLDAVAGDLTSEDAAAVVQRSAGWPLLIEDLVAALVASMPEAGGGRALDRFGDVTLQRLGALDDPARQVVRAAAVLGPRFDWRLLTAMTGLSAADVGAAIRAATAAQLLAADERGAGAIFRHALTAEVVVADLDPAQRAALRSRAADAVAASGIDLDERLTLEASLRAAAGESARAASLHVAVAERAVAVGALASAEGHLRTAAGLAADDTRAASLLLEVLVNSGQAESALTLAGDLLARVTLAGEARAAAELLSARACLAAGQPDAAGKHLGLARRNATARQRAEITALEARVILGGTDPDRVVAAEHVAHRAVAEAAAVGAPALVCESLEVVGRCARLRDLDSAEEAFERALAVAESHGLALWRIRALNELGTIEMFRDTKPDGLIEARRAALAAGALSTAAGIEVNLAAVHTMRGEFGSARLAAESCETLARRCGLPDLRAAGLVFQGVVAAHEGRFADMRSHVRAAERLAGGDPDVIVGTWAMCRGTAALLREDRDKAWQAFETAANAIGARPALAIDPVRGPWLLLRAAASEVSLAEIDTYAAAQARGARWSALWEGLSRAMVLGAAGATVPASEAAEEALAAGHPMPLFSAIGLRLAGESALRDGWGQPDAWLTAAEHTFAALGHSPPAAACRDLLRQAGRRVARPRAVDAAVPATLRDAGVTAREYEVLRLAAQRHTNAEIAARLYVSPRTVEKHIASLLAKTGATSRRDLADIAPGDGPAAEHGG